MLIRMVLKTTYIRRFLRKLFAKNAYKYIAKETCGRQLLRRHTRIVLLFCNIKWRLQSFYCKVLCPSANVYLSKSNEFFPLQPHSFFPFRGMEISPQEARCFHNRFLSSILLQRFSSSPSSSHSRFLFHFHRKQQCLENVIISHF